VGASCCNIFCSDCYLLLLLVLVLVLLVLLLQSPVWLHHYGTA
jgi:hypothetical protein